MSLERRDHLQNVSAGYAHHVQLAQQMRDLVRWSGLALLDDGRFDL